MTIYINPETESKEAFLAREGTEITVTRGIYPEVPAGQFLVVWVNNGPFTAAGVIEGAWDFASFSDPSDDRPTRTYLVPGEKLVGVVPVSRLEDLGISPPSK